MTVRVERVIEVPAPIRDVWSFISDPEKRASAISVVVDFSNEGDGRATWTLRLPIPMVNQTVSVNTREVERDSPRYVRFVGRSSVMDVTGEHELEELDEATRLTNTFVVDGRFPGVERFFKRNMDDELDNLDAALKADLGLKA